MRKTCRYCGQVHKTGEICPKRPPKRIKKQQSFDGFQKKYVEFTSSFAWQKMREITKKRDLYLCAICRQEIKNNPNIRYDDVILYVHHIIPVKEAWALRLCLDNLITLCDKHHKQAERGEIPREVLQKIVKSIPPM